MAQTIGNPAAGIGGMQLGMGASGPLVHLWATGDPNTRTDTSLTSASVGSLFSRFNDAADTTLYVKTALPNTWTAKVE